MKRLFKIAGSETLYHGTGIEALMGITESGAFMPSGKVADYGERIGNYTFFGTYDKAAKYAKAASISQYDLEIIIELNLPDNILLPDDIHCRDCKTWQESFQNTGQVKVEGNVETTYITNVEIIAPKKNISFSTPFSNWQEQLTSTIKEKFGIDGQLNQILLVFAKGVDYPTLEEQQVASAKSRLKKLSNI